MRQYMSKQNHRNTHFRSVSTWKVFKLLYIFLNDVVEIFPGKIIITNPKRENQLHFTLKLAFSDWQKKIFILKYVDDLYILLYHIVKIICNLGNSVTTEGYKSQLLSYKVTRDWCTKIHMFPFYSKHSLNCTEFAWCIFQIHFEASLVAFLQQCTRTWIEQVNILRHQHIF